MSKYSKDLDQDLVEKVKKASERFGLKEQGVNVVSLRLKKSKTYGEIVKGNELTKLFAGEDVVAIALYEDALLMCDEQTQDILIENLLEQIKVEEGKDGEPKTKIEKSEIAVGIQTYHTYGNVATQRIESVLIAIDQIREKEKEEKAAQKESKRAKKQQ